MAAGIRKMEHVAGNADGPEDLFRAIEGICSSFGQVSEVQFFCRRRVPNEIVCFVDMTGNLAAAARALRGYVSGENCVFVVGQVPEGFRCLCRPSGQLTLPTCYACHVREGAAAEASGMLT
jgi:hypothetical protein